MSTKRIGFGRRPAGEEGWVQRGETVGVGALARAELYPARLTIDVSTDLRGRIKVAAFCRGVTVADVLRELLEREFPKSDAKS